MHCSHPGCRCANESVVRDGRGYCSQHCADAGQGAGRTPCGCDHPDCDK